MRRLSLFLAVLTAAAFLVAVPAGGAVHLCNGLAATQVGTNGPDVLVGTPGIDVIVGLGGDDTIRGLAGNDHLCGNGGNDTIYGGNGKDYIDGGNQDDYLLGLGGGDTILGGSGHDAITGGAGYDKLYGGPHRDVIRGGGLNDKMYGEEGEDTLIGGPGTDLAHGGPDRDWCKGETRRKCEGKDSDTRLEPTGIGDQMFGDLTDAALLEFAALLGDAADEGDPDEDSGWIDSFSGFGTCPNDEVRVVRWGDVQIFNTRSTGEDGTFFTWEITDPADNREDKELMTGQGVRWNDTMAQVKVAYGSRVTIEYVDVFDFWLFYVDGNPSGIRGTFTGGDHFDTIFLLGGGIGCGE
ncbi:MAG: calcium-binding protein [Acidimicrobiia bacterium]|nr:calcium-binding protein [Acidimicrobiia bacterium]